MRWHYEIRDLASLPRVRGITDPPCMADPWLLRRIRRAAAGRDCCWHHGVNWHLVSETAIGVALQAQASGTSPEDTFDALDLASLRPDRGRPDWACPPARTRRGHRARR